MNLPEWFGQKDGDVIEIELTPKSVMLTIIATSDSAKEKSFATVLDQEQILVLEKNRVELSNWIQPILNKMGAHLMFRLLGSESSFTKLREKLSDFEISEGKHVPLKPNESTQIIFLPREGRIRIPKQPITASFQKTKVLVVDDSETIRKLLSKILSEDPDIECVGAVETPSKVFEAIERLKPDVITLDIHMPEMDGVTLLKKILPKYSIPTVMISALSIEDGTFVLDALEAGAVDYIQKPSMNQIKEVSPIICEKIKSAKNAKLIQNLKSPLPFATHKLNSDRMDTSYLIAIGSSTGGTEALKDVLTLLPEKIPPIVIVQHIPPVFSKAFAERMNQLCPFEVKEAEDGDPVTPGRVLIAPGGKHMRVKNIAGNLKIEIVDTEPVNRHKPSVDVLFDSVAALKRKKTIAAILTGMGADGAKGLLKLRQTGARTIAQDEDSCVVFGMPREAIRLEAAEKIIPLNKIAETLVNFCTNLTKTLVA